MAEGNKQIKNYEQARWAKINLQHIWLVTVNITKFID